MVEGARLVRAHIDGDDEVDAALVAFLFKDQDGFFRFIYDEADDAEFRAVVGEHGVNIDVLLRKNGCHAGEGALTVRREDGYLL